ncbi:peptide deformylase [Limimonas halophila]|uniref:Peptide deformylase n=1 Tax=Limimonas halophila TaxID=1082479 RepID=A0A1G7LRV3_9PROT|nr:peptide deformylase [Limimonas halophila]SDF51699.1 peptide deformylase [Limimonas halophila]
MAIRKVARMGHPVLRTPAAPVGLPVDARVRELAADMLATMRDEGGVGLAGPQIHESLRMIVFHAPAPANAPLEEHAPETILLNPDWEPLDDTVDEGREGCLSIPGLVGEVPRWYRIRYWGWDLEGQPLSREAVGFHARVVQHECDHLDGILYLDRMPELTSLAFTTELGRETP